MTFSYTAFVVSILCMQQTAIYGMQVDYAFVMEDPEAASLTTIVDLLTTLIQKKDMNLAEEVKKTEIDDKQNETLFYRCIHGIATRRWRKAQAYFSRLIDLFNIYAHRVEKEGGKQVDETVFQNMVTCARQLDEEHKRYRPAKEKRCVSLLVEAVRPFGYLSKLLEDDDDPERGEGNALVRCIDRLDRNRAGRGILTIEKIHAMEALGVDVRYLLAAYNVPRAIEKGDSASQHSFIIDSQSSFMTYEDSSE
jgi:hypothetical protein